MEEPGVDGTMDGLQEALSGDQLHNHNDDEDPTTSFPEEEEEEEEICLDSGDEEEEILAPLRPRQIKAEPGTQKDDQAGLAKITPPTEQSGRPPAGDEPGGAATTGSGGGEGAPPGDDFRPPPFSLPVVAEEALPATRRTSGELEEGSPSVVEGTTEEDDLLTMEELNDSTPPPSLPPPPLNPNLEVLPESSLTPADEVGETGASPPSTRRPPEPSPPANGSAPDGPSALSSSSSSGDSSPQTKPSRHAAATPTTATACTHAQSSPYDTDCSRKLISEIQRSLSQESLLDDLESEIMACRLSGVTSDDAGAGGAGGPGGKANHPVNGLLMELQAEQHAEEEECMVAFEKCVQFKYTQQEQAIKRLLDENKKHQDLIVDICSEKDVMRGDLKKFDEMERLHISTINKLENRVDELLKELRESRDKLVHQEQRAKASLQQAQRDTTQRLEQVKKKCEEARQEKETMVMKYVRGEKEALDLRRDKEALEKKLREATKEVDRQSFRGNCLAQEKGWLQQLHDAKVAR